MDGKWKWKKPLEHLSRITYGCVSIYTNVSLLFLLFETWSSVNVDVSYCCSFAPVLYCVTSLSQLIMMYCVVERYENELQNISLLVLWKQHNSQSSVHPHTTVGWLTSALWILCCFKYNRLYLNEKAKANGHCELFKVILQFLSVKHSSRPESFLKVKVSGLLLCGQWLGHNGLMQTKYHIVGKTVASRVSQEPEIMGSLI